MSFLFAYLGTFSDPPDWPVHLIYITEAAFVIAAFVCALVLTRVPAQRIVRGALAVAGGVSAGFGLIMPLELAPFFFHARGEIMLATIGLNLLYPVAVFLFILLYKNFVSPPPPPPPPPKDDEAEGDLSAASTSFVYLDDAEIERAARDLLSVVRAHPGRSNVNLDAALQQHMIRLDNPANREVHTKMSS